MNFNTFFYIKESLDIASITKSEREPISNGDDIRKSYEFTYDGSTYSYNVSILGSKKAREMARATNRPLEVFLNKNKDDVFSELTGALFVKLENTWKSWHSVRQDLVPREVIESVKAIADLKQNLSPETRETFGDLYDEL